MFGHPCICDNNPDVICTATSCTLATRSADPKAWCGHCHVRLGLHRASAAPAPGGPGTELKALLSEMGLAELPGCQCAARAARMDGWGVDGCRQRRDEIVGWLREGYAAAGWLDRLRAAGKALARGINWSDPLGWLVDEAIRRAEAQSASVRPILQVETRSAGIGDSLMSLCIAVGLRRQRPGEEVVLCAPRFAHPWLSLFVSDVRLADRPIAAPTCYCDHTGDWEAFTAARVPRWQYWERKFGTKATLPEIRRLPARSIDAAVPHAGAVVIAPFAAYPERTWPVENWLAVEADLERRGFKVTVIDDSAARLAPFRSGGKLAGRTAHEVAAVISMAACFAGNDSGMAHLAGLLGVRSVVVCGDSDENIMGMYPTHASLSGRGRGGLQGATPEMVVKSVLAQVRASVDPEFPLDNFLMTLPERDNYRRDTWGPIYATLWRTVRELNPSTIVEIGSRAGASAWVMLDACPSAHVVAYDVDELDASRICDGGYDGAAAHARRLLAGRAYTRIAADSLALEKIPECDLCLVDGEHSEAACYSDLRLAQRSGAKKILADDYCLEGVRASCTRFLAENPRRRGRFIPSQTGLFLIE